MEGPVVACISKQISSTGLILLAQYNPILTFHLRYVIVKIANFETLASSSLGLYEASTRYSKSLTVSMDRCSDSPDGILVDKNRKLDTSAIEGHSF